MRFFLTTIFLLVSILTNAIAPKLEVVLRSVGDLYLKSIADSQTVILPIELENNSFLLSFSDSVIYEPDLLVDAVNQAFLKQIQFSNFVVTVSKCDTALVVHSFEVGGDQDYPAVIPCRGRSLKKDCYQFRFHITSESFGSDKLQDNQQTSFFVFGIILALLGIGLGGYVYVKNPKSSYQPVVKLGMFEFNPKLMSLKLKAQSITLSGKETALLVLLHAQKNQTIAREVILKEIWGDEGDYVGRTLDVFVSKLRKKLAADPTIHIKNIRGVGYKLVVE